jgi:hypothetical protein
MRSKFRSPITAILALSGTLLSGSSVLAADFTVDFGAETDAGRDAGTLTCLFRETCGAQMESLGLRVSINMFRRDAERAYVHLHGGDLSCCYFAYAADEIIVDPRKPLSPVAFFKGARARGGLFVQNNAWARCTSDSTFIEIT